MAVVATGMGTQLGHVAELIQGVDTTQTPLQRRLNQLGRSLAIVAAALVVVIFVVGVALGEDWELMFMTAISMAVAVVPEGLPAVVTIALALGAQRMLKRQALIRKLPAVETLGSVTVICSDKTGTLTENRMTVTVLDLAGHRLDLTEEIHHREPALVTADPASDIVKSQPSLALLLMGGALCNDAFLQSEGAHPGQFRAVGDPTEGALVVAAARFGLWKSTLETAYPRTDELPFDSDRKRMTTIHRIEDCGAWIADCATITSPYIAFAKGSVDGLMTVASAVWSDGQAAPLDDKWRQRISDANELLAGKGMRVLGVAFKPVDLAESGASAAYSGKLDAFESGLILVGLVGMIDPPRPEVKDAVATCRAAGIRPVMITGDHPLTARQIALDLGISEGGRVLTGQELAGMSMAELEGVVEDVSVYARVSPEHKLNIVEALQKRGHVVAMTGDGVNDAPALRRADIGVAMGITGTDVSKEAAAMVLLDDNFTTIVAAVEEGRAIYDNIRKFIKFSLAGNLGKVLAVFAAPLMGLPLLFSPFQLLWLNLVTDGVLGLGMSVEPAERGAMQRPPHKPSEGRVRPRVGWADRLAGDPDRRARVGCRRVGLADRPGGVADDGRHDRGLCPGVPGAGDPIQHRVALPPGAAVQPSAPDLRSGRGHPAAYRDLHADPPGSLRHRAAFTAATGGDRTGRLGGAVGRRNREGVQKEEVMARILEKSRYLVLLAVGASLVASAVAFLWGVWKTIPVIVEMITSQGNDPLTAVSARVSLEQKLRPVEAFQARGHVNDGRP